MSENPHLRYEPEEHPPHLLAAGMGAQIVAMILTGIMLTPLIVARTANLDSGTANWLVFAAALAAGLSTWLQVARIGRIGSGHVMFVGSNAAFIAVSVTALEQGGPALLATLAALSAFSAFLFTWQMPAMRRILTPAVGGVVLMLMAMSVAPVVWTMMKRVPAGFEGETPLIVATTVTMIFLVSIFSGGALRLWAPLIGVLGGSMLAAALGMVDFAPVAAAAWIGLPQGSWPGLDVSFSYAFWALLPAFVMLSLVACIETYADSISAQRHSRRVPAPIDFRAVQGAINADGIGSFMAGVLGTVPNTVYSSSVAVVELTGVAARRVGWWGGFFLILIAFCPKISALIGAIPGPVAAAFLIMILVMLFGNGIRLVTENDLTFEVGLAVCLGFWVGFGFQQGVLFNDMLPDWARVFLSNGTTSGGLTAIVLMGIVSLRARSRDRLVTALGIGALTDIQSLVRGFAERLGWDRKAEDRLMLAAEESLLFLLAGRTEESKPGQLRVRLRHLGEAAEMEYVTAPADGNIESALAALQQAAEPPDPAETASLRLLRAMAKDVKHLQYYGTDCLILTVDSRA
jgi:xanthine permease XanP